LTGRQVGHGQAHAVHRDGVTVPEVAAHLRSLHPQPGGVAVPIPRPHAAEFLDDTREHGAQILLVAVRQTSSPTVVISGCSSRTMSSIVATPMSARTGAPAPSRAGAR